MSPNLYPVDAWLSRKVNNKKITENTASTYRYILKDYATFLFPGEDNPLDKIFEYIQGDVNAVDDISRWLETRSEKSRSGNSLYVSIVLKYLKINHVQIDENELEDFLQKHEKASGVNDAPDRDLLKQMFNSGSVHQRVLLALLASTGCRIGELIAVMVDDLDLKTDPARIRIRKEITKTRKRRYVFLTTEARGLVEAWLKVRERYAANAAKKTAGLDHPHRGVDNRLLCIGQTTAWHLFMQNLKRVHPIERHAITKRSPITPHSMRRWFRTVAVQGGMPIEYTEMILGHKFNLSDSYSRENFSKIAEAFKKAEYSFTIMQDDRHKQLEERVGGQSDRLLALERERDRMATEMATLKRIIDFA